MDIDDRAPRPSKPIFHFSLKSLLLSMLLIAVFLGGRATWNVDRSAPRFDGKTWEISLIGVPPRPVTLTDLGGGRVKMYSAADVFNGVYEY